MLIPIATGTQRLRAVRLMLIAAEIRKKSTLAKMSKMKKISKMREKTMSSINYLVMVLCFSLQQFFLVF